MIKDGPRKLSHNNRGALSFARNRGFAIGSTFLLALLSALVTNVGCKNQQEEEEKLEVSQWISYPGHWYEEAFLKAAKKYKSPSKACREMGGIWSLTVSSTNWIHPQLLKEEKLGDSGISGGRIQELMIGWKKHLEGEREEEREFFPGYFAFYVPSAGEHYSALGVVGYDSIDNKGMLHTTARWPDSISEIRSFKNKIKILMNGKLRSFSLVGSNEVPGWELRRWLIRNTIAGKYQDEMGRPVQIDDSTLITDQGRQSVSLVLDELPDQCTEPDILSVQKNDGKSEYLEFKIRSGTLKLYRYDMENERRRERLYQLHRIEE